MAGESRRGGIAVTTQAENVQARLQLAERARSKAEAAYGTAQQANAAAVLRAGVRVGEECPVCDQLVAKQPRMLPSPNLDAAREKLAAANASETDARAAF